MDEDELVLRKVRKEWGLVQHKVQLVGRKVRRGDHIHRSQHDENHNDGCTHLGGGRLLYGRHLGGIRNRMQVLGLRRQEHVME